MLCARCLTISPKNCRVFSRRWIHTHSHLQDSSPEAPSQTTSQLAHPACLTFGAVEAPQIPALPASDDLVVHQGQKNQQITLTSLSQPGAGAFLTAIPKSKADKVEPRHFAQLIRIRLGLDMRNQSESAICVCKQPITSTHLQVCTFSNQTRRHEAVVD